nr:ABC transporter substrate-binding protein/permease [Vagococcus entomophilus]
MKNKGLSILFSLLATLLVATSLLPAFTASADTTQKDPVYEKIKQKGEIIVGLSADYAPYEFHTTIDGKDTIVGFDISIAQKIADDLGVKLKIEELGFDALLGAMKTGKIDMIVSGMSITEERLKEVNFSNPYLTVTQRLVLRKTDKDKYKSFEDFSGKTIAVQKQTTQEALAKNEISTAETTSLQKIPDVIMNVTNKKADAAIIEEPVAEAYLQQNKELTFSDLKFENGKKETAVAVPKNAPTLLKSINDSIATIKKENLLPKYKKEANALMFDNKSFLQKYGSYYVKGTGYTILLAFIGVLFGAIFGGILALLKLSHNGFLRFLASAYIEYVRGTPLLVQIFLVYFGTAVIGLDLSKMVAGCIALALNSGAYVAEIIRAGIKSVNKGQTEAARSLGMNQSQAMRFIIFPQAIKSILPALGNEFVTVIKESSVISVIGVAELMFQAGNVQGASFKPFLPYLIVSLIYFVLTFTISKLLGVAERRMSTSD